MYDCVIIGAGAAGLSCALACSKAGLEKILVLERDHEVGGILQQCIHTGFGLRTFKQELTGPSYAHLVYDQIKEDEHIEIWMDCFVDHVHNDHSLAVYTPNGYQRIEARSVVLASGSKERSAGSIGLRGSREQGVYTAGAAQRYLNMDGILVGRRVFILGSGDIGLIMARRMSLEGAKVLGVAEIMPYSNGLARNIKQCLEDFDIPLYLSHTITKVSGHPHISSITLCQVDENKRPIESTKQEIEVDCVLLSVGLMSEVSLFKEIGADFDGRHLIVDDSYMTSVSGFFACGNALHIHDLVDDVYDEGIRCGKSVVKYLEHQNKANIKVCANTGISYVIPQKISAKQDVTLSFRVNNVYKDCKLRIFGNGFEKIIVKPVMLPSLMEHIVLKKEELNEEISSLSLEVVV